MAPKQNACSVNKAAWLRRSWLVARHANPHVESGESACQVRVQYYYCLCCLKTSDRHHKRRARCVSPQSSAFAKDAPDCSSRLGRTCRSEFAHRISAMVFKRAARRLLCLALLLGLTTALAIAALQPQTAMEDVNAPPRYMRVPHRLHDGPTLRLATKDDLDGIMRIVRAGFPDDPEVDYRFPARGTYPEDYLKWTRLEYEHYIEQPDKFVVHLAEIPDHSGSEVVMEPVALAVWDTAVLTKANGTGLLAPLHRLRDRSLIYTSR